MSVVEELKKSTGAYVQKLGVASPQLDYIDDAYVLKVLSATPGSDREIREGSKTVKESLPADAVQPFTWSGYLAGVSCAGTQCSYFVPQGCPRMAGPYTIESRRITSLRVVGSCGNYTLYYAVID